MSKLIFDDTTYSLKRNPYVNWLFFLFAIYVIINFYINGPQILETFTSQDLFSFIIHLLLVIFFDGLLLLIILLSYFFNTFFEFDSRTNQLVIYSYFIWWKRKFTSIDLKQFKDLYIQQNSQFEKLFLDPRDEHANKIYLTTVHYKVFKTAIWQSFITDLKRNFEPV